MNDIKKESKKVTKKIIVEKKEPTRFSNLTIDTIRVLGVEMIEKANSGHPGIVLGAAPIMYALYKDHLVVDPENPSFFNRDRFVLSAGHGSALLYATMHLAGYKNVTIEDLKNFRQINSNIREKIASGEIKNVNVIIRTDVHGSNEAIKGMIDKLVVDGANLTVIKSNIGEITESDVRLAQTSNAMIIGFNVKASRNITELANNVGIVISFFDVIYKLKEELISILKGCLDPIYEEKDIGEFLVLKTWRHSEIGTIAGGKVTFGKVTRKAKCRVIRDGIVLYKSEISSLRHERDDIKECLEGKECGMVVKNFNDIKENDIIQIFEEIQKMI